MVEVRAVISPEEAAELERLKAQYLAATARAIEAIQTGRTSWQAFLEADGEARRTVERAKEILGITRQR